MQPQDNDFPIDQVQGGGLGNSSSQASQPTDATAPLAAGSTFHPQTSENVGATPTWHNDALNDANQLYAQPANSNAASPDPLDQPISSPAPASTPSAEMANDFNNSANLSAANPLVSQETNSQPSPSPVAAPEPVQTEDNTATSQPQLSPKEPIQYDTAQLQPNEAAHIGNDPYAQPQQGLPGSENLGAAVAGVYQQDQMQQPQLQMNQPYQSQMQQPMGASVPQPPKKSKKWIFILLGVIIALAAIGGGVYYYLSMRKTTVTPTTTTQSTQTNTTTPTPKPDAVTPPAGYELISKQCYSFALYMPNTVPKDEACSFAESTFGNKKVSKISVETSTNEYKTVDEFLSLFKSSVTVVSENKIKLNNSDATQIIYKFTDGRTYSKVFTLLVGKSYQQDGKPVTGLALTTSYQETFDMEVTNNVIDTWRWK